MKDNNSKMANIELPEMKTTVSGMKNTPAEISSRVDTTEEKMGIFGEFTM